MKGGECQMKFHIYKNVAGHWQWRLLAANNKIVADSAESYWNKNDCLAGITLVKGASQAPVYEV